MASAKEYRTEQIRNVVLVGHGGCGKTSLIDALSYVSGTNTRHGKVEEGSSLTMYRSEEQAREMSLYCTPAYAEWAKHKINLLDTPGYLDFFGEVDAATRVVDAGLVVVSANSGVEIGTQQLWKRLDQRELPRIVFISKMDKEGARFEEAWTSVSDVLGKDRKLLPLQLPIGSGSSFQGIADLLTGEVRFYKGTQGEFDLGSIPSDLADQFEEMRTELMETVAESDEELLDKFLEEDTLEREELLGGLSKMIYAGEIVPVFCGSSHNAYGVRELLQGLIDFVPDPSHHTEEFEYRGERVELKCQDDSAFSALIFKTTNVQHVGDLFFFKVFSGAIKNGGEVYNADTQTPEKLGHLSIPLGKGRQEVDILHAGDIGVIAKLRKSHTNETFSSKAQPYILEKIAFPSPDTRVAISGATHADDDKLGNALSKLREEDPTFFANYDSELRQTIARGLGDLHLQVQFDKLKERYGVNVVTAAPHIAYRETIKKTSEAQGRHKKQTGGRGQFGDCHLRLRPRASGEGYEFIDSIVGGVIPSKYVPAVDKGVQEAALRGFLAGYPVVDFSCECYFGSYHAVDSSEMAFKVAGSLGFRNAMKKAEACLLEPTLYIEVTAPSDYLGDISGDVSNRRGRIQGMDTTGGHTTIKAIVPESELYGYAASVRSMTQGMGSHTRSFHGYEEVPSHVVDKIIADSKKED